MPSFLMQLIIVLAWLAIPVGLVCVVDDWLLKPTGIASQDRTMISCITTDGMAAPLTSLGTNRQHWALECASPLPGSEGIVAEDIAAARYLRPTCSTARNAD